MREEEVYQWLVVSAGRVRVILDLHQPLTAVQISKRTGFSPDRCGSYFYELALYKVVRCLNDTARRSRLYWLTDLGKSIQSHLRREARLNPLVHDIPVLDWDLVGWVCFEHRSAVVKALSEPLQPAAIKRRALAKSPKLRMSANNTREVVRLLLERGVIRKVSISGERHARYELTDAGRDIREFLVRTDIASDTPLGDIAPARG